MHRHSACTRDRTHLHRWFSQHHNGITRCQVSVKSRVRWTSAIVCLKTLNRIICSFPDDPRCVKKTGNNPDPDDCSRFVSCANGTLIAIQRCGDGTLYWPKNNTCEFAQAVVQDCGNRKVPDTIVIRESLPRFLSLLQKKSLNEVFSTFLSNIRMTFCHIMGFNYQVDSMLLRLSPTRFD